MIPYPTVSEADEYFATRLESEEWDCLNDSQKYKALLAATRLINNLRFKGNKSDLDQENKFPRDGEEIPTPIKEATCEIAYNLLDGTDMEQEIENLNVTSQTYATVNTSYNPQLVSEHMRAGIPSAIAWNLLKPYLVDPRVIRLRRG